jgi:cystathionine beta-lyase
MYNFDKDINRLGTNSHKYDDLEKLFGLSPQNTLSMWTADMDFKAPDCVFQALNDLYSNGIFGYYGGQESYNLAVKKWYEVRHGWTVDPKSISVVHGLCSGIGIAIRAFSNENDGVIVFTPVYHSFINIIKQNNRKLIEQTMEIENGEYQINFEKLENSMTGNEKILLFCSPHNPGGRVWSVKELKKIAQFCDKHDLILISDEIHNDLVYPQRKHVMFPIAAPEILHRLVVLVSSSKTFNIAGGLMGNVIIQNHELRKKFQLAHQAIGTMPNLFGMQIAERVYLEGASWLDELLLYLEKNKKTFDRGINNITGLKSMKISATYLAWVDFSGTNMSEKDIIYQVHHVAGIAASIGSSFGKGGEKFMRFNLACPKNKICEALKRLEYAFNKSSDNSI